MPHADARQLLQAKITELGVRSKVSDEDELYYDLGISGVDFFELIGWVGTTFEIDFSAMNVNRYAPGEGAELVRPMLRLLGFRPYKSITVAHLLKAVDAQKWAEC